MNNEKHQKEILSHLEDYSSEELSAEEAAEAAHSDVDEADFTAHGDYAEYMAGDFKSYLKHHDSIHEDIGDRLKGKKQ